VSEERSLLMAKIRGKNSLPERMVRSLAHKLGYRFRLHRRDLPGCPDIVFPSRRKVILVHGCFWHQHHGCTKGTIPKTRRTFWKTKLTKNVNRDRRNIAALKKLGWAVLVIWECQLKDSRSFEDNLKAFLHG
jgi:DNA mismatch endonuclease (patch repair protein)